MRGNRRKGREAALQIMYQAEVAHQSLVDLPRAAINDAIANYFVHFEATDDVVEHAGSLVLGILLNLANIDEAITQSSPKWRLDRMALVDKNVLRMACYEMLFAKELESSIIMNEAIEIAKRFGSERSGAFVNGVLDAVYKAAKQKRRD